MGYLLYLLGVGASIAGPLWAAGYPIATRHAQAACHCTCRPIGTRDLRDLPLPATSDTWTPRHSWLGGGYFMVCAPSGEPRPHARARLMEIQDGIDRAYEQRQKLKAAFIR